MAEMKEKRRVRTERRLRPLLMGLAVVNTIFLPIAGDEMLYGLVPTEVSILANLIVLHKRFAMNGLGFKLFVDSTFAAGFLVWFVFGNIFLGRSYGSRAVVGTWSTMVTLMMLLIHSGLVVHDMKQIKKAIREHRQNKPHKGLSISVGCVRCEHCRAATAAATAEETRESEGLTARDEISPPTTQRFTLSGGLRQWAAGYQPLFAGEQQYEDRAVDEDEEHGQIRLSQDVDNDARPHDGDTSQQDEPKGM